MQTQPSTDAIWTHLSADLRRFIRRRVSDDHAADDLLQETFVRIHRNLRTLHDADRLAAWVYQIARNVIQDFYRQKSVGPVTLPDDAADREEATPNLVCQPGAEWLGEMVEGLPHGYRQAVQLAEIDGLTHQEVADRLGLTLPAAKSRIQRGRLMLRKSLDRCCSFHLDHAGRVMDCDPLPDRTACRECGEK